MEKAGSLASPVAVNLITGIESMAPEVIQTGYSSAKGQVVAAAASVDASLCSGVDSLVDKVPVLKQATPALYKSTKEGVTSYATLAATYIASFTLAQLLLKASDVGLETADSFLKWTSASWALQLWRQSATPCSRTTFLRSSTTSSTRILILRPSVPPSVLVHESISI